ncbi:lipopolysaccharide export system permease protein [Solimonas aquatica]|uniref:Lipopolysaccharide export system permease protein LptF n=1 Tax=Solimonas aquatica TaxID=489703 RepID=A0A1H9LTE4_9GAMM|nr:LPS export ABC transporter permease LptF [Solimonas aquatica]SER14123.1 lipopolysaccharide export system permease protein [Solimonas aquatica]
MNTLSRYIFSDAMWRWAGASVVLLGLAILTRALRFVAEAALGRIPAGTILPLIGLQSLQFFAYLMPATVLLAVMMCFMRLHDDRELSALFGCGVSPYAIARPLAVAALLCAAIAATLSLYVSPWAARTFDSSVKAARAAMGRSALHAGELRELSGGRAVIYAGEQGNDTLLSPLFAWRGLDNGEQILVAHDGRWLTLPDGNGEIDVNNGEFTRLLPKATEQARFASGQMRVSLADPELPPSRRRYDSTASLWKDRDPVAQAELQRRIGLPLSCLLMVTLAFVLAPFAPRAPTRARMAGALLVYAVYNQLLTAAQRWTEKGTLSVMIGQWWVHALLALALGFMLLRRYGGLGRAT